MDLGEVEVTVWIQYSRISTPAGDMWMARCDQILEWTRGDTKDECLEAAHAKLLKKMYPTFGDALTFVDVFVELTMVSDLPPWEPPQLTDTTA
jgi:hypothetical protein